MVLALEWASGGLPQSETTQEYQSGATCACGHCICDKAAFQISEKRRKGSGEQLAFSLWGKLESNLAAPKE